MSSTVEQIKEKLSIVEVVGSYITLEKAGANLKAKCPFHNEKTASFFISPDRGTYYCFGCGAKGDVLSFVQQFEGLDFVGALRILAERAGVELTRENKGERSEKEKLFLLMEHATLFFQRHLADTAEAKAYLKKRGLSDKTIKDWRLGYSLPEWQSLHDYLAGKGFSGRDMEKAGLVKAPEKVKRYYDRFRGRIMFPISDASGRVVAFSGRQFVSDNTEAKYLNSPETALFEKSKILYGYDKARNEIRKRNLTVLVEGQMDLLMAHQAGVMAAVATSGTALTRQQLEIIRRLSSNLVICYDGDAAGQAAARRGWQIAISLGLEVKIAQLPEGKDPADLALEDPRTLETVIASARHIVDVELARIVENYSDPRECGKAVTREILPYVIEVPSVIERSHFISKIALETGVGENVIWEELKRIEKSHQRLEGLAQNPESEPVSEKTLLKREHLERSVIGLLYWQEKQAAAGEDKSGIRTKIETIINAEGFKRLEERLASEKDQLMFEAEVSAGSNPNISLHLTELVLNLKEEYIKEDFNHTIRLLQLAENRKELEKAADLLKHCQELSEELKKIAEQKLLLA